MKIKIIMVLLAGGVLMAGGVAFGQESQDYGQVIDERQAAADVAAQKAVEVGNKICPVSGEKVPVSGEKGEMGAVVKYEYSGKIYNLCCPMCVKSFKKDPAKYSKIAEDEVQAVQK